MFWLTFEIKVLILKSSKEVRVNNQCLFKKSIKPHINYYLSIIIINSDQVFTNV